MQESEFITTILWLGSAALMEDIRYTLLTGATGLVGRFLLMDLLRARLPVAVISRPTGGVSAQERIDHLLSRMEQTLERTVPRPIVFSGDLCAPGLGLSLENQNWIRAFCGRVLHCAASVSFKPAATHPQHEPRTTNVLGTRQLAEFCADCGIAEFHHVSSAYVCGRREGTVLESEADVGQDFCNDYEASKCEAEELLQALPGIASLTIYRPSIVIPRGGMAADVGVQTLQLAFNTLHALAKQAGLPDPTNLLQLMGLTGSERKNIVPADWISRLMIQILRRPELHGMTYHLTHAGGMSMLDLLSAFHAVLSRSIPRRTAPLLPEHVPGCSGLTQLLSETLSAYFRDDPVFDQAHLMQALQVCDESPSPEIEGMLLDDLESLVSPSSPRKAMVDFSDHLETPWERLQQILPTCPLVAGMVSEQFFEQGIGLTLTGAGGGDWQLSLQPDGSIEFQRTGTGPRGVSVYLSASLWNQLLQGQTTLAAAHREGRLAILFPADADGASKYMKTIQRLLDGLREILAEMNAQTISMTGAREVMQHGS